MITGTSETSRMSSSVFQPSSSGITTSRRTTSGLISNRRRSPSLPFSALATVYPPRSSRSPTAARTVSLSSMIRTVLFALTSPFSRTCSLRASHAEPQQVPGDLVQWEDELRSGLDGRLGHAEHGGCQLVLRDRQPPRSPDRGDTCASVPPHPGQHDGDCMTAGGR